jgi:hypothetical protein
VVLVIDASAPDSPLLAAQRTLQVTVADAWYRSSSSANPSSEPRRWSVDAHWNV